jgi:acyl dehydratase
MYGHIDTLCDQMATSAAVSGPYFDDLEVGQVFDSAPSMTLSSGAAGAHQSIIGDRLRLPLDAQLTYTVTGATAALAHPALVCDVAIGQSTLTTQRVKANLFYRGLTFHRFPVIGDSLFTRTEVVGLKQNSAKPGRTPTGLAALRMTTVDQIGRLVLDFYRCAMLPLSAELETGRSDDRRLGRRRIPREGAGRSFRLWSRRCGAAQHRRRSQQRAGARATDTEYRCDTP